MIYFSATEREFAKSLGRDRAAKAANAKGDRQQKTIFGFDDLLPNRRLAPKREAQRVARSFARTRSS